MIRIFFKNSIRSLQKNRIYSFLNIFGLTIGITCAALIFLWVEDEMKFDDNHVKKNQLYMVRMNNDVEGGVFTHSSTPALMGPSLLREFPGIANTCRSTEGQQSLLFAVGDKSVYASGVFTESSLFSMLTIPFVQGNPKTAFAQLNSIVITENMARKCFGDEKNVLGKTIRVDNKQDFIVTGVVKDNPENSSLQFEWLSPFQNVINKYPGIENWNNFGTQTLVELKPGIDPETINRQLANYIQKKQASETSTSHAFLFSMNDWRLYDDFENGRKTGGGRIQYVHLFSVIAWIILGIACINFMNLATARSEKRAREVGVRKVLGSGKRRLIFRFLADATFLAFLAALAAVILIALLMPAFNNLVQKNLSPGYGNPLHILALLALVLICGLIAGSYPALYLSSFNPVNVLKGIKAKSGSATFVRKGLVVLQFAISIILIIGTIIIYQQIQHVKGRNIGYPKDNLIQMSLQGDMGKNYEAIKQDLFNTNLVENVAIADHNTLGGGNNTTGMSWAGKDPNSLIVISQRLVSQEFISTIGLHLREGRDFRVTDQIVLGPDHRPKDTAGQYAVIITESMEKLMGNGSAIGKLISREMPHGELHLVVIGVIQDYIYGDMYEDSRPVMFYCIPDQANLMYVRIKPGSNPEKLLSRMEAVMKKNNPVFPFEYQFVDDQFNQRFLSEMLIGKLSRVFASLAVIISCLGLFGLAAYTAERRTKEVGIRKVLGASVTGISVLLSKDFLKLVLISCLFAFPVAWWLMNNWLLNYRYRIEISWLIFLMAGLGAISIALFTVIFQAIKAAVANPVVSLRSE